MSARDSHALAITAPRHLVDRASARVAEAHQLRDFVKRLAGSVVARAPDSPVASEILDREQRGVTARHDQREVRHRDSMFEQGRQQMTLDMIHADHRDAARLRESLRKHQADQQRAHQAGTARDCDSFDVREAASGGVQRALDNRRDRDDVIPRREFRHDAAVCAMDVVLIRDSARTNFSDARHGGFEHRGGRVVARRFNSEYQHRRRDQDDTKRARHKKVRNLAFPLRPGTLTAGRVAASRLSRKRTGEVRVVLSLTGVARMRVAAGPELRRAAAERRAPPGAG